MKQKKVLEELLDYMERMPPKPNFTKLQAYLLSLSKVSLEEPEAELLMQGILKYFDTVINITSNKAYREQIKLCRQLLDILQEVITDDIRTVFVKKVTQRVFDILIEEDINSWCVKKELLKMFLTCIQNSLKDVRKNTVKELPDFYLFKIVDSISTYGDYDFQVTLIEVVFRMYGKSSILPKLTDIIPESQELSESFANINGDTFDEDVRKFLNILNENSGKVFSIVCNAVFLGTTKCGEPIENVNGLWVDFNLCENAVSWYSTKDSLTNGSPEEGDALWSLLMFFVSDVESVQVYRPPKSSDTIIYIKLKTPCISPDDDQESIVGSDNIKLVISYSSNKVTTLLTKVLPSMFKHKFHHNTPKVSLGRKSVYKPLKVSVCRRAKSDSSKTKSDVSLFTAHIDPTCDKSIAGTSRSGTKALSLSSASTKCEVISISDSTGSNKSSTAARAQQWLANLPESQYETAEMCPLEHSPKVSVSHCSTSKEAPKVSSNRRPVKISSARQHNSAIISDDSSLSEDIHNSQERIQILSGRCSGSNFRFSQGSMAFSTPMKQSFSQPHELDGLVVIKSSVGLSEKNVEHNSGSERFETANESLKMCSINNVLSQVRNYKPMQDMQASETKLSAAKYCPLGIDAAKSHTEIHEGISKRKKKKLEDSPASDEGDCSRTAEKSERRILEELALIDVLEHIENHSNNIEDNMTESKSRHKEDKRKSKIIITESQEADKENVGKAAKVYEDTVTGKSEEVITLFNTEGIKQDKRKSKIITEESLEADKENVGKAAKLCKDTVTGKSEEVITLLDTEGIKEDKRKSKIIKEESLEADKENVGKGANLCEDTGKSEEVITLLGTEGIKQDKRKSKVIREESLDEDKENVGKGGKLCEDIATGKSEEAITLFDTEGKIPRDVLPIFSRKNTELTSELKQMEPDKEILVANNNESSPTEKPKQKNDDCVSSNKVDLDGGDVMKISHKESSSAEEKVSTVNKSKTSSRRRSNVGKLGKAKTSTHQENLKIKDVEEFEPDVLQRKSLETNKNFIEAVNKPELPADKGTKSRDQFKEVNKISSVGSEESVIAFKKKKFVRQLSETSNEDDIEEPVEKKSVIKATTSQKKSEDCDAALENKGILPVEDINFKSKISVINKKTSTRKGRKKKETKKRAVKQEVSKNNVKKKHVCKAKELFEEILAIKKSEEPKPNEALISDVNFKEDNMPAQSDKTDKIRRNQKDFEEIITMPEDDSAEGSNQENVPAIKSGKVLESIQTNRKCVVLLPRYIGLEKINKNYTRESFDSDISFKEKGYARKVSRSPEDGGAGASGDESLKRASVLRHISKDSADSVEAKKRARQLSASTVENDEEGVNFNCGSIEPPYYNCEEAFEELKKQTIEEESKKEAAGNYDVCPIQEKDEAVKDIEEQRGEDSLERSKQNKEEVLNQEIRPVETVEESNRPNRTELEAATINEVGEKTQAIEDDGNKTTFNQTLSTTFGGRKRRKLYNPDDLSYLENMTLVEDVAPRMEELETVQRAEDKARVEEIALPLVVDKEVPIRRKYSRKKQAKDAVQSKHREKKLVKSRKLKIVNPNATLDMNDNQNVSKLQSTFYEMLESFRKEAKTSFSDIVKCNVSEDLVIGERKKAEKSARRAGNKNAKNATKRLNARQKNAIVKDRGVRKQREDLDETDGSLRLKKRRRNSEDNIDSYYVPPEDNALPPGDPKTKINIISDIRIRPKRVLLEDNAKASRRKMKAAVDNVKDEVPIVSENITNEEICHWIETGSPNYSQTVSERRIVFKHLYPVFKGLLGSQPGQAEEFKDALTIYKILKKYA